MRSGGAYVFQIEREDEAHGKERATQHLAGFAIRYQRELIPRYLALGIAKPFYFAPGRFDSPFAALQLFAITLFVYDAAVEYGPEDFGLADVVHGDFQ